MRVPHVQDARSAKIVSRADFDADRRHGYVCFMFNPEREEVIKDRMSGREYKRTLLADVGYRCVDCQFDTIIEELMLKHRANGDHPWPYTPFENPYGNCSVVEIEGIADYMAFLEAEKEKR